MRAGLCFLQATYFLKTITAWKILPFSNLSFHQHRQEFPAAFQQHQSSQRTLSSAAARSEDTRPTNWRYATPSSTRSHDVSLPMSSRRSILTHSFTFLVASTITLFSDTQPTLAINVPEHFLCFWRAPRKCHRKKEFSRKRRDN